MCKKAATTPLKSDPAAYTVAALSIAVGAGSLVVFTFFLYVGPFNITDFRLGVFQMLLLDACLCIVFFLQHSGMVRKTLRYRASKYISERFISAVFSVTSGVMLLILVILWQESTLTLASAEGLSRWSMRTLFFLAGAGQVWGIWSLKSADLFGTDALLRHQGTMLKTTCLVIRGPYRWVRHPLYFTTLLMIWSYPDLTADRLLFNVLFTLWIIAGTVLEERDLVEDYGDDYRGYQRAVPMLIPYRKPTTQQTA